ncbi:MAG: AMP-binding protein, partial [Actinobacteria bacterium]|nr:AMP-binding protein [Actinomycetota bacterium]
MLVDAWLPRAAAARPAQVAVNSLSYRELLAQAERAARQLSAMGVARQDRVGIELEPGEDFAVALHAVLLLGAVAVPIDPSAPTELKAERTAGARTVISGPLLGHEDPAAQLALRHELNDVAVVIYSSGSSGSGKAIELTYGNFWWSAAGSAVALGLDPDERWLSVLPLTHVGGMSILMRAVIYGTTAIVEPRFDRASVLERLSEQGGPTLVSLVPTTLQRLLDVGLCDPPSLRWVLLGGGPISPNLVAEANRAAVPLAPSYGMTEACSQVVTLGAPLFCTQVDIAPSSEVLIAGPTVAPQCGDWLRSGDLASRNEAGELEIVGRLSEIIISGGENISPERVEEVLLGHPAVADVAVVGRADPDWGEAVTALIVPEG